MAEAKGINLKRTSQINTPKEQGIALADLVNIQDILAKHGVVDADGDKRISLDETRKADSIA